MRLTRPLPNPARGTLVFSGRGLAQSPAWVGTALLVGVLLLNVAGGGPLTTPRLVVALLVAAVSGALIYRSMPREHRVTLDVETRAVAVGKAAATTWAADAAFRLVAAEPRGAGGQPRYGVALVPREGDIPVILVAADDPAAALADLEKTREALPLPVQGGWGLPGGAPWIDRPAPEHATFSDHVDSHTARRRSSTVILVGAVAIALGVARTVNDRISRGETPSALSVLLPALGVVALFSLGLVIRGFDTHLAVGDVVVSERRFFGLCLGRTAVARGAIRRAYLVSPDGGKPVHLLVDGELGPTALLCDDDPEPKVRALLT